MVSPLLPTDLPDESCYHCGLPVPDVDDIPRLRVLERERHFCCQGCKAVCGAIVDAGLEDYYRQRSATSASAAIDIIPAFLKQVDLYDRPEIQQDFVISNENWCEAYLLLENIRCAACLWLNEKHLRSLPGVVDVHIDDVTQRARVRWDPNQIKLSDILTAITQIGYVAHPYDASRGEQLAQERRRRNTERLIFAGVISMLIMKFSIATYFMTPDEGPLPAWIVIGRWTSFVLTTMILLYSAEDFFVGAWKDIRNRRLGMDIPIVMGLLVAYFGSLYTTLTEHGEIYYDAVTMFVFFLLISRRLELRGKLRAAGKLEELARITPKTATRMDADGTRHKITVSELVPDDVIRLLPGETLPVDGVIVHGLSSFDESLLTGESIPVTRQAGDPVFAGSINGEQAVDIRVTHSLQGSTLSEIRRLVEGGLAQRPRYALLAEKAATWFITLILIISALTAYYWAVTDPLMALPATISVLIVTCPCALALAAPVALTVSAGRFVEMGVLPLRMNALDALALSKHFIFDKTGTLTRGKPMLVSNYLSGMLDEQSARRFAAALAADSEHPVAKALQLPEADKPAISALQNVAGSGTKALIDDHEWRLGKPDFIAEMHPLDTQALAQIQAFREQGYLVSLLGNHAGVAAVFAFSDQLRPHVQEMMQGLRDTGVRSTVILSGDAQATVTRTAEELGISTAIGGMSPQDKFNWARQQQERGEKIVMFGDGINDAPSLALADASVSFADATDLANNSSDFLIMGEDARLLARARQLARDTRRNILQNFGWAAGYNVIAIPFAAAGLIPPWGASIGMSLSSLVVVMNALRLQKQ